MVDGAAGGELFEALLAFSADPVLLTRADGAVLRANPAACTALGYGEAEFVRLRREELVAPGPELQALLRDRARERHARGEVVFRRRDGSTFPAELATTVVARSDGADLSLVTFRDVGERRRLERELKESEARFRAAFHTLPDAVTLSDQATGRFVAVNEGAFAVTGWPEAEMLAGSSLSLGLWSDDDRLEFVARLKRDGAVKEFRTTLRRKDGSTIEVVLWARPLVVEGKPLMLTVTRDVSAQAAAERARDTLQAQLLQSQKLEAIGRLAGGVAHDFNNQLTVILSCCEVLDEEAPSEELTDIKSAAQHAAGLTRQLLAFARKQVFAPRPVQLGAQLVEQQRLLTRVLGEDVELALELSSASWPVFIDPVQLEQVVLNLAVNARDAMPRGGKLTLAVSNCPLDEKRAACFPGAAPGDWVKLSVTDTGVGMSREVAERAFEPFFTTKVHGRGTGLGLATVQGIVSQGRGFVRLESTPGQGSRFEIIFPRSTAASPEQPAERLSGRGGTETLLLVEDDARVRQVMAEALRKAGYRVLAASNGVEARALASREPIALVVSDVVMPTEGGRHLVGDLRAAHPAIRALLVSGYPQAEDDEVSNAPLLLKPFSPAVLLARVREVLDA